MRTKSLLLAMTLALPLTTLFGCTDLETLESDVTKYNLKIESLTNLEKAARKSGAVLESEIREYISEDFFTVINLDEELLYSVKDDLGLMETMVINYNDMVDQQQTQTMGMFEDGSFESDQTIKKENHVTLNDSLETFYFLDTDRKLVEQLFLLNLPNGQKYGFSILWVEEGVIGYEEMVID